MNSYPPRLTLLHPLEHAVYLYTAHVDVRGSGFTRIYYKSWALHW